MKYARFSGTEFKQRERDGRMLSCEMVNAPFNTVKEDLARHCQTFVIVVVLTLVTTNAAASLYAVDADSLHPLVSPALY